MLSIRTARLVLEPLTVAHAPAMFVVLRDPLIYRYLDFEPPESLEHLSRDEWQQDCIADMISRGYREAGKTRSNTFLLRG